LARSRGLRRTDKYACPRIPRRLASGPLSSLAKSALFSNLLIGSGPDAGRTRHDQASPRRNVIVFALGILCYWAAMYVYVPTFSVYAESLARA